MEKLNTKRVKYNLSKLIGWQNYGEFSKALRVKNFIKTIAFKIKVVHISEAK